MTKSRPVKPDAVEWGRIQAARAPAWSDRTFREACACLGIRVETAR